MLFQLTSGGYMAFQLSQNVQSQNLLQWLPCSLGQNYLYKIYNWKKKKDEILVRQVQIAGKLTLSRVNYEEKKKLTVDLLYKVEADIKT